MKDLISIGEAQKILGVSERLTLRRWERQKLLIPEYRLVYGQECRFYRYSDIQSLMIFMELRGLSKMTKKRLVEWKEM